MSKRDLQVLARKFVEDVPFRTIKREYEYGGQKYIAYCGYGVSWRYPVRLCLLAPSPDNLLAERECKWSDLSRKLTMQVEDDLMKAMATYTKAFNDWVDQEFEREIVENVSDLVCGTETESSSHAEILVDAVEARYAALNSLFQEKFKLPSEFSSFKIERHVVPPKPDDIDMPVEEWNGQCSLQFTLSESGVAFDKQHGFSSNSHAAYLQFLALPFVAGFAARVFSMIHQEGKK